MATLRRYRRERRLERSHSPERSVDIENYDYKINRYQRANWGDKEAKEAHASVVKYLWRKENELSREIEDLKKKIAKQVVISASESKDHQDVSPRTSWRRPELTKREIETPLRGLHFRTIEDKTFEKLDLIRSERKLENNMSYIAKIRSKANSHVDDAISEDLKSEIRGKSANAISIAILQDAERSIRCRQKRDLENAIQRDAERSVRSFEKRDREKRGNENRHRTIYDIMADRNRLGISHDHSRQHRHEEKVHGDHDSKWTNSDYLNLVGYRMQNNRPCGCRLQNHNEIIW